MVPDGIIHAKTDKPAEQKVELQSLHQLALGANAVKRLQHHRPKQLLRRNRWPAKVRIKRSKCSRQIVQRRVRYLPDRSQRMVAANPGFQIHVTEQRSRPFVSATHPHPPIQSIERIMSESTPLALFSTAC
jgi:hypothetical protein